MKRRPLTGRGLAALLSGGVCLIAANILGTPLFLYLGLLLILLVMIAAIAVRAPRRTGGVRRTVTSDLLTVGEDSRVIVRFAFRSLLGVPNGTWSDALPDAVAGKAEGLFPPRLLSGLPAPLSGNEPLTFSYPIRGVRRGVWAIGPLSLSTTDPFGLVRRMQDFGETHPVTVVPAVLTLPSSAAQSGVASGSAQHSSNRVGQGADNLSPRRYVPGDSMRRIHWRATAHRGTLMVRQEEQESHPDAIVVLDRTGAHWRSGADFENAVSACASIAIHLAQHGYSVDVMEPGGVLLGELRGGEDDRDGLLVTLASVHPRGTDVHVPLHAATSGHLLGPLVVLTGTITAAEASQWAHGGAVLPVLMMTSVDDDSARAAAAHGWRVVPLGDDIAGSWADATSAAPPAALSPVEARRVR
ncbi:DUF58 domain-containing protein [Microbacterium keratanolyticum]